MTNPMLAELDEVVRLMEAATPGLLQPEFVEAYNVRAAHGGIFAQIHNLKGRHGMGGRVDGNEAANNARLIASAINFLRTHHATLADMAKRLEAAERDAARFAPCLWAQDADDGSWDTACGNKHMFIDGDAADNLYQHCPYCGGHLIEPNYAAIDATQEGEG